MVKKYSHYPDGGYGWIVTISSAVIIGLTLSIIKCTGQIYASMLEYATYTRSQVASVIVLPGVLSFVLAIFTNKLAEIYSFRFTLFLGSFFMGLGMCLSSLAPDNIVIFTISFVIIGIGMAFSTAPSSIVTGLYFKEKRSIAMGLMTSLAGTTTFFIPIILQWLLDEYLLQNALLLFGGFLFHGCIAAMLIRQPTWALQNYTKKKNKNENKGLLEVKSEQQQPESTCTQICYFLKLILTQLIQDCRHFRNYIFVFLLCNRIAFFFSHISVLLIIPQFAREQIEGTTTTQSAFLLSVITIADVVSKLVGGWINNYYISNRRKAYLIALLGFAGSVFCFQYTHTYISILVVCTIYGIFNGYLFVSYFLVMFDAFGPAETPGAIGVQFTVKGLFLASIGPVLAGIRDLTGNYKHCFTFLSVFLVLSVLLWVIADVILYFKPKKCDKIQDIS